jgi:hypothetical protein
MRNLTLTVLATTLCTTLALAGSASALIVAGDGTISDWGVKPFTLTPDAGSYTSSLPAGVIGLHQSDYSPIDYGGSIGHQPSPGGSDGKMFDLEEIYVKHTGTTYKVLLVDKSGLTTSYNGVTWKLGDLLIDPTGDHTWSLGVVTQNANEGLVAGGLYSVTSTDGISTDTAHGSYGPGSAVGATIGAWAVKTGTLLSTGSIQTATYNYGTPSGYAAQGTTNLIEYTFTLASAPSTLSLQLSWSCGNDLMYGSFTVPNTPANPAVPEPTTLALGGLGLAGLSLALLRRRR